MALIVAPMLTFAEPSNSAYPKALRTHMLRLWGFGLQSLYDIGAGLE